MSFRSLLIAATRSPRTEALVAGAVAFVLVFSGTARLPVINGDEARFAEASLEMLERGDPVVPTFGGRNRYDKPPVIYWLTAASYALFGPSPRTARLPSNVAATATVALVAWWTRRRAPPGAGLLAGTLLAVTPVFLVQGRSCTADAVTVAFTAVAILCLDAVIRGDRRTRTIAVLWAATAMAILTKGPVAPVYLVAIGTGLWALGRRWKAWEIGVAAVLLVVGMVFASPIVLIPVALAAALDAGRDPSVRRTFVLLPWTMAAWSATDGEFFRVAIGRHVLERGLSPLEGHSGFPGFYVATATVLGFPWFGALLAALPDAWRCRHDDLRVRFLLAWLLAPVAVLEVTGTKLVHYVMAAYPAAVLLVVDWAWRADSRRPRWLAISAHAVGGAALASIPAAFAAFAGLSGLMPAALVACTCLLIGVAASSAWLRSDRRRSLATAVGGSVVFLALVFNWFIPELGTHFIGPRLIARGTVVPAPHGPLAIYRLRDEEVLFHGPRDLVICRTADELAVWWTAHPDGIGLARRSDLEAFDTDHPQIEAVVLDRVHGFDLGRGRSAEGVVFRLHRSD